MAAHVEPSDLASQIEALQHGQDETFRDKLRTVLELDRLEQARKNRAVEADRLLADLDCMHRDALAGVIASCRLLGRTVPPSLPPKANLATSTSKNARADDFAGGKYVPEAVAVLSTLNQALRTELVRCLREILDLKLYAMPLLICRKRSGTFGRDCFPVSQNEDETEWHIAKLRAVFASFIRLVNAFLRPGTPHFVFGANSPKFDVFTPDGLFWLGELAPGEAPASMDEKRASPRMQFAGKRRDKDLKVSDNASSDTPFRPPAPSSQPAPASALTTSPIPSLSTRAGSLRSAGGRATPAPPSPSTLRANHPILSIPRRVSELAASGKRSYTKLQNFDIRMTSDKKLTGQGVMLIKVCDVLLQGPPTLRIGNCSDADFSFNTFALSIYHQPSDDAPPAKKRRFDTDLVKRRFIREDDAVGFALVVSPLVKNDDSDLLLSLFSCIVPHRRLQRSVAQELIERAKHVDLQRYIAEDLQGTLTPPAQVPSSPGASVVVPKGDDKPPHPRDPGHGPRPSGPTGGGQDTSGAGRMGAGGQPSDAFDAFSDHDDADEPASSPSRAAASPFACSSSATSPSSSSSVKTSNVQERKQCSLQNGEAGTLDYLAVSSPPLQLDYLPVQYRPAPAKPTRWIRCDKPKPDASNELETTWTELAVTEELVSSSDYRVVVATSSGVGIGLVIKEEIIRFGNEALHSVRNEATTYDALAAAGLGSVCAPYVGLFKVVDGRPRCALVTERWGEPLNDFQDLSLDERIALGEMMCNLHIRGFYHGDFAARNVLIGSERKICAELVEALEHLDLVVNEPSADLS
ncbi:lipopolysaccharide kinase [Rhodotorula toruloides]|uniref:Lipopolysaccharide kinase n=1 Tax=Rhodotorula toruloides TaxID=5286 RepID=A0A511KPC5_RHOTO|nr:lipopolysaccharide kinase [Rhodotorula toruloides]